MLRSILHFALFHARIFPTGLHMLRALSSERNMDTSVRNNRLNILHKHNVCVYISSPENKLRVGGVTGIDEPSECRLHGDPTGQDGCWVQAQA